MKLTAKANLLDVDKLLRDLESQYDDAVLETEEALCEKILRRADTLFNWTLQGWQGGGHEPAVTPGWKKKTPQVDKPRFEPIVEVNGTSVSVKIVADNWLWKRLDEGAPAHKVKPGHTEVFQPITRTRTAAKVLKAAPNAVYSGKLRRYGAGSTVPGFEGRGWTDMIAEKLLEEFSGEYAQAGLVLHVEVIQSD